MKNNKSYDKKWWNKKKKNYISLDVPMDRWEKSLRRLLFYFVEVVSCKPKLKPADLIIFARNIHCCFLLLFKLFLPSTEKLMWWYSYICFFFWQLLYIFLRSYSFIYILVTIIIQDSSIRVLRSGHTGRVKWIWSVVKFVTWMELLVMSSTWLLRCRKIEMFPWRIKATSSLNNHLV